MFAQTQRPVAKLCSELEKKKTLWSSSVFRAAKKLVLLLATSLLLIRFFVHHRASSHAHGVSSHDRNNETQPRGLSANKRSRAARQCSPRKLCTAVTFSFQIRFSKTKDLCLDKTKTFPTIIGSAEALPIMLCVRYYPGQKKKEPSARFAVRRTLFDLVIVLDNERSVQGKVMRDSLRDFCPALIVRHRA